MDEKFEATVSPGALADLYFSEARDFLQSKLQEAMLAGHLSPEVTSDIYATFAKHFDAVLQIAHRGQYASDVATAAQSTLTITIAAFMAGSRDPSYLNRVKRTEGVHRAAKARESKATSSASHQLNEMIVALAEKQKNAAEDLNIRRDRMRVSARIKPSVDQRADELRSKGCRDAVPLASRPSRNA